MKRNTPLKARNPLRGKKPGAAKRPRDTGPPKETRQLLAARSGGMCEICGTARAVDPHHRLGRKAGGTRRPWVNRLSNIIHACRSCHQQVTDTNGRRVEFEVAGWLLREGQDPLQVPVRLAVWGPVVLDDCGGFTPAFFAEYGGDDR